MRYHDRSSRAPHPCRPSHEIGSLLMSTDLRLYALIDPERAGGRDLAELAGLVASGGGTLVQLRDKHGAGEALVEEARLLLGTKAIIGRSVKTRDQAEQAPVEHLDYVCIGGVFATSSKDNPDPPIGLSGLQSIFSVMRGRDPDLPIGAIAGIDATNAGAAVAAGID